MRGLKGYINHVFALVLLLILVGCGPRLKTPEMVSFEQQKMDVSKLQSLQGKSPDLVNESLKYYVQAVESHNDNEPEESSYYVKLAQISWQTAERRAQYLDHRSKMTTIKMRLDQAQKLLNLALKRKKELSEMQTKQANLIRKEASERQNDRKQAEAIQGEQVKKALIEAREARDESIKVKAPELAKGLHNKGEMALKSAEAAIQRGDFINAERIAVGAQGDFKSAIEAASPLFNKEQRKLALDQMMADLLREASQISGARAAMEARGVVLTLNGVYRRGKKASKANLILDQLVALISKYKDLRLMIEGHTTSHGSRKSKLEKSERMANEVLTLIKSSLGGGLKAGALGRGDYAPLVGNTKSPQNERIDVVFFKPRVK
jgi:outer membrane protein OmpA-like peptidoglycan-associated protein